MACFAFKLISIDCRFANILFGHQVGYGLEKVAEILVYCTRFDRLDSTDWILDFAVVKFNSRLVQQQI